MKTFLNIIPLSPFLLVLCSVVVMTLVQFIRERPFIPDGGAVRTLHAYKDQHH